MSHEFIQARCNPKRDDENKLKFDGSGVIASLRIDVGYENDEQYEKDVKRIMERNRNIILMAPVLDKEDERMTYLKSLAESTVNLLHDVANSMKFNKSIGAPAGTTENHVHEEMLSIFRAAADILQWMVNSTSWREGDKFHDFDRSELRRKFGLLGP